jgi:uncharacterized protein YxjI
MSLFLQTLAQSDAVYVKQKFEIGELFGFETRNRYQIQTDDGRQFGFCAEPKLDFMDAIARQFLGHWRVFDLVGTDMYDRQVFCAHHPFRWFFQRLDIFGSGDRLVGSVQQRFAWFNKRFDFLDSNERVIMTMTSPLWKIWTFPIKKGERDVSVIEKKWTGFSKELFTDADNFRVRFVDPKLTADEKLLLLASAMFVDLLYFEKKASR